MPRDYRLIIAVVSSSTMEAFSKIRLETPNKGFNIYIQSVNFKCCLFNAKKKMKLYSAGFIVANNVCTVYMYEKKSCIIQNRSESHFNVLGGSSQTGFDQHLYEFFCGTLIVT